MQKHTIERFVSYTTLQESQLFRRDRFKGAEIYDDMAVLEFELPAPLHIDELLDIIEDCDDLILLYHVTPSEATVCGQQFCAYAMIYHDYIHKVNAVADDNVMVSSIYVTLYDTLEHLGFDLLGELEKKTGKSAIVHFSRTESDLLRDFMS